MADGPTLNSNPVTYVPGLLACMRSIIFAYSLGVNHFRLFIRRPISAYSLGIISTNVLSFSIYLFSQLLGLQHRYSTPVIIIICSSSYLSAAHLSNPYACIQPLSTHVSLGSN